ncbi:NUDIX hydrolase [Planotetraspora sp. A-T 1434]|uniref:NUDIX domain-containing protein n=1 Tax=Planotetraspora sp. A-T 1434 TaxID=2979219 RepID=UPI0021BFEEDB|nr:NUDIX hydrolase [Planotetraspora sp. A-T 1434]MCT9931453.1 NUDIX hydrolase [Planotetraspora sp. A-T 1434]
MDPEVPLYERDPVAWNAYLAEGNAKQARKRVGADVLIRDEQGRILLVDPKYKPDWDLPGGMAEANESPAAAARREIKEELGLDLDIGHLLVVDWVSPHGPWNDSLMFIFDGGVLSDDQADALHVVDRELMGLRFADPAEAMCLLRPYVGLRVRSALHALQENRSNYHERGDLPQ